MAPQDKSGYHQPPYKVTTILLAIFPMLYILSPWCIYFVTGSLPLPSIPFTYFTHSCHPHFLWQLSMSLLLFCYAGSFVLFLDSTYKWNHMIFVFDSMTYFTYHTAIQVHQYCHKWQDFILYYGWVIVLDYVYHKLFVHLSISEQLLQCLGCMNIRVHVYFQICVFVFFGKIPRSRIAGSYGNSIFFIFKGSSVLFS